jgi:hypothetical protein
MPRVVILRNVNRIAAEPRIVASTAAASGGHGSSTSAQQLAMRRVLPYSLAAPVRPAP